MKANKHTLADLKRLRKQAPNAETPIVPAMVSNPATSILPVAAPPIADTARPTHVPARGKATWPGPGLTADDVALFRRAVKSVQRIKDSQRAILPPTPTAPASQLRQRRELAMGVDALAPSSVSDQYMPVGQHDDVSFIQAGCGPDLITGLTRGKWPVKASLDLHGATLDQARDRLDRFLHTCIRHRIKCVRVVHGKGYGSKDGESILKQHVRRWLTQVPAVLAYCECAEHAGGTGAVDVLLRITEL